MNIEPVTPEPLLVWIIEDNESFRENIAELVGKVPGLQHDHSFHSCESALKAFEGSHSPDLVLMDIGLPGMNGIDGVRRIKAVAPETRIIMLTVFDENDMIFQAICAGASGYLLKSEPMEKIVISLQEVLRGGAPINAQIARKIVEMFSRFGGPKADYRLTPRELTILQGLVDGLSKQEIADNLLLSYHTIDMQMRGIYSKLHVHSRSGAIAKAWKEHLL